MCVCVCAVIERESQTLSHMNNLLIGIWHWDVASIPVPLSLSLLAALLYPDVSQTSAGKSNPSWFWVWFPPPPVYSYCRALSCQFDNYLVYTHFNWKLFSWPESIRAKGKKWWWFVLYWPTINIPITTLHVRLQQRWEDASRCMSAHLQIISSHFSFIWICMWPKVVISE